MTLYIHKDNKKNNPYCPKVRICCLFLMIANVIMLSACGGKNDNGIEKDTNDKTGVELTVVTTFAGNDGNAQLYREACSQWVKETGNAIIDMSTQSDETFKTRVANDFETGSEPDVLFFFYGADASNFIKAGKVVSLSEVQEQYPDFASNLNLSRIPTSMVDDEIYAIPVNGYWEAMFVNKTVLEKANVKMPDENTTWEEFLEDCEKIKEAGFVPIAAALGNIPHYWWEISIFNHTTPRNHMIIPATADDILGQAWVAGLEDIKYLYQKGYFPYNTNSASDDATFQMFMDGRAAFLVDGSWKLGSIVQGCQIEIGNTTILDEEKLSQYSVTFVPGTDTRKATDMIGGMSMGYYITRRAWEDEATRDAAISFVSYMTSDEVALDFAQHTTNALKNVEVSSQEGYNSLQLDAIEMISKATSFTGAVQDVFQGECRVSTFDNLPDIVNGKVSAKEAVRQGIREYDRQE